MPSKITKPTPAEAVANIDDAIARAMGRRTADELQFDSGFYPVKLAECRRYAKANGFPVDRVAGAVAAFSPGFDPTGDTLALDWLRDLGPDTLPAGDNRPAGLSIPYGYATFALAHNVLWGRVLGADAMPRNIKRGEYLRAILGDPTALVIDVHAYRDMCGDADRTTRKLPTFTPKQYAAYRAAFVAAGMSSADQAVIWGDRRRAGRAHANNN